MELDVYEAQYPGLRDLQRYGRVSYTHGLGIDQALSAVRSQTHTLWSVTVFLHPNWQGQYVNGTNLDGLPKWCAPGSTEPPRDCRRLRGMMLRPRAGRPGAGGTPPRTPWVAGSRAARAAARR